MTGLLEIILSPTLTFMRNAFLASVLSAVLFGVLGSVVTVKRIAGLAGAISHAVLGGIGMSLYLSVNGIVPGMSPITGAVIFAILAAIVIGAVSLRAKQREDTVINAIWAIGMSIGVLFMARTSGYTDPSSYLFGNILLVTERDLWLLAGLDAIVLFLAWKFYPQIEASSFDEEFARVRGVHTTVVFLAILTVTAVSIVLLQTFVGVIMVIAMLTLPAGTAGFAAKNLAGMMVGGSLCALAFSLGGLAVGWQLDLPVGATVVVIAGAVFLVASAGSVVARLRNRNRKPTGRTHD